MKTFDQRQKVRDIQARFTQNVDLVSPARYFIKEGKLTKICRKRDIAYIFILFSDLLIYGETSSTDKKSSDKKSSDKNSASSQIKIHQQIPINQSFRIRDIPQNIKYGGKCWEIHSPTKSFIVYADHPGLKHEWYSEMEKVVKLRKTIESGKQRPAALWVPDDFTTHCMMDDCDHKFNVLNRRHHCRYCGRLVCGPCSTNKLPHWSKSNKTVRVCSMCFQENENMKMMGHEVQPDMLEDDDSMSAGNWMLYMMYDMTSIYILYTPCFMSISMWFLFVICRCERHHLLVVVYDRKYALLSQSLCGVSDSEIYQFYDSEEDGDLMPINENDDSVTASNSDQEKKNGPTPIKAMTTRKKTARRKMKMKSMGRSQSLGDERDTESKINTYVVCWCPACKCKDAKHGVRLWIYSICNLP